METRPSALDDPDYSAFAWARYKKLMWWMALASLVATIFCLLLLDHIAGPLTIHMLIATAGGVFFSVMLAAALMGLVFLSSGSGHDDAIDDPFKEEE